MEGRAWSVGVCRLSWFVAVAGAVGFGCAPGESAIPEQVVLGRSAALQATPADPVAFCLASGLNVIIGDAGPNTLVGTTGADCIVGLGGADNIRGNGGNDIIFGGDGDDTIVGGNGNDLIFGGAGNDNISGNGGADQIFGEAGDDRIDGGDDNDVLNDCQGANTFVGGAGSNVCQGQSPSTFSGCQTMVTCNASDWAQFQHDATHGGVNPDEGAFTAAGLTAPLQVAFKAHFGDGTIDEAGPVEADGVLYIADFGSSPDFAGRVSAFNAAGCGGGPGSSCEPMWQGPTGGDITTTPAVGGGFVMVASRSRTPPPTTPPFLFAFDVHGCPNGSCQPAWRGALVNAVSDSSPVYANGIVYVGDFAGRLYAFDVAACAAKHNNNCQPLWTGQAGPEEELTTAPVVGAHFVLVSSLLNDPNVFTGRLNAFTLGGCGNAPGVPCPPAWTADIVGPGVGQTVASGTVFVTSGTLFGDGPSSNFHALAFSEAGCGGPVCAPLRTYDTGDVTLFGGALATPVVAGSTLLVSSQNTSDIDNTSGVVSAYSADGSTGCKQGRCEPIWIGASSPPTNGSATPPAVAANVVFVGRYPATGFQTVGNDAGVFAFDLGGCGSGQRLCAPLSLTQVGLNQLSFTAPLAIARGKVFFSSNDNDDNHSNVYALSPP
jgi:Ca2+-binding RTX toxin-like protein